jgi:acetyl esterase
LPPKYALAPEFADQKGFTLPSNRLVLRLIDAAFRWQRRGFPWSDAVTVRTHRLEAGGARAIPVLEVAPKSAGVSAPAIVDYHGGAFFLSTMRPHLAYAERYAVATGARVFVPEYRLSLDHPFPAPFDDAVATLAFVHRDAAALGIDRERILVLGDSAGGALAAGVAQHALDQRGPKLRGQILIYPVTDHDTKTGSARDFVDTPGWTSGSNRNMWKLYLRDSDWARRGRQGAPPPYAAPLHRARFDDLPPAFVEVAEFDPLRDEGIAYARALEAAGVPVELHVVAGGIHGYDLVEGSPTAAAILAKRLDAIRRFLA